MNTVLHVNSSGRNEGSYSRRLGIELIEKLAAESPGTRVIERDIATGVEFIDQDWISANFTPAADRNDAQVSRLAGSDSLVREVQAADMLVIAVPIYNFSIPGVLKAWIDQICRAGVTFRYTQNGPEGLLQSKKAYLIVTSGGTQVQGPVDFATDYLVHVLGFIGITDVTIVNAGQLMKDEAGVLEAARATIEQSTKLKAA